MYAGRTVFSQVMDYLPLRPFHRCVARYGGDYKVQSFSCLDQSLYTILQFLSVSIFEKTPIWSAFSASDSQLAKGDSDIQLTLFDL